MSMLATAWCEFVFCCVVHLRFGAARNVRMFSASLWRWGLVGYLVIAEANAGDEAAVEETLENRGDVEPPGGVNEDLRGAVRCLGVRFCGLIQGSGVAASVRRCVTNGEEERRFTRPSHQRRLSTMYLTCLSAVSTDCSFSLKYSFLSVVCWRRVEGSAVILRAADWMQQHHRYNIVWGCGRMSQFLRV